MNFIRRYFAALIKGVALTAGIVVVIFVIARHDSGSSYLVTHGGDTYATPEPVSRISKAELEAILFEVYHVEKVRWIQPDLIWVTLPLGADVQPTCQAIANIWAHRSGLPWVRVESWRGNVRLGQGTVRNGYPVAP